MSEQLTRLTGRIKQKDDAPFFLVKTEDIDASDVTSADTSFPNTSLKNYLAALEGQLLAKAIEVTNFIIKDTNNNRVAYLDKGDNENLTLHWEINRVPQSLTINGIEIDPNARFLDVGNIDSTQSWTIVATDQWGSSSLPITTTIHFYDRIYYGTLPKDTRITDSVIYNLNNYLTEIYDTSFSVKPKKDEYIYFIAPKGLSGKTPEFSIGNLVYEWDQTDYIHTSKTGCVTQYTIWKHPQLIEEEITIAVKGV